MEQVIPSIIEFAKTVSPLGVIAILSIIIYQLIRPWFERTRKMEKIEFENNEFVDLSLLNRKLDKIAGNHLHDLPNMRSDVSSIKESVGIIQKEQIKQGNRLTRVETILKIHE